MNAKWMVLLGACGLAACDAANSSGDAGPDVDAEAGELDAEPADAHAPDANEAATEDGDAAPDAQPRDAAAEAAVEPTPCTVTAPTACPDPAPTYADVEPIFDQYCIPCHSPDTAGGPWSLHDYRHVADWQDTIRSNLLACTMPPPDAGLPIPAEDSMLILTWLRCDLPR